MELEVQRKVLSRGEAWSGTGVPAATIASMAEHTTVGARASSERYGRRAARFRGGLCVPARSGMVLGSVVFLVACSGGSSSQGTWDGFGDADRSVKDARKEMQSSSTPRSASQNDRPAALIGNETVSWADLSRPLAEAAGAAVLEEICVDRLAAREMENRRLKLDPGAIEQEEALLVEAMRTASGVGETQSGEVIERIRRTRGLGTTRYRAMLTRNAMLRRLVRDEVSVTPDDIQQAFEIRYGQKYQTRLIVTRTEREAGDALARVRGGERFADVATSVSIDTSRLRGGAIGAISPADPSFPLVIRRAITATAPGVPSPVIGTEQTFAIVLVESVVPPVGEKLETVSASLEREVRAVRERAAMDRLASQLLRSTNITVLDPSLEWSWRARE